MLRVSILVDREISLNWNPHPHCIVTDGGFTSGGVLHVPPRVSLAGMEELFRRRVLRLLGDWGKLQPERVKMLLGWPHSGFNLDASVRIGARDERGGSRYRGTSSGRPSRWRS